MVDDTRLELAGAGRFTSSIRCNVASFVPVEFWMKAREACEEVRPGCIWLAETVHSGFGQFSRKSGLYSNKPVTVTGGKLLCEGKPVIIACPSLEEF